MLWYYYAEGQNVSVRYKKRSLRRIQCMKGRTYSGGVARQHARWYPYLSHVIDKYRKRKRSQRADVSRVPTPEMRSSLSHACNCIVRLPSFPYHSLPVITWYCMLPLGLIRLLSYHVNGLQRFCWNWSVLSHWNPVEHLK